MKVPYAEDLANHSSPESCGGCGNVSAEALTGGSVGGLLSSEITFIPTCGDGALLFYFFFIHFLRWFSYFAGALSHRGTVYLLMVLF